MDGRDQIKLEVQCDSKATDTGSAKEPPVAWLKLGCTFSRFSEPSKAAHHEFCTHEAFSTASVPSGA